jgi:hypothetical protein
MSDNAEQDTTVNTTSENTDTSSTTETSDTTSTTSETVNTTTETTSSNQVVDTGLTASELESAANNLTTQTTEDIINLNQQPPVVDELALAVNATPVRTEELHSSSEFIKLINTLRVDGTANQKAIIQGIDSYIAAMMPGIPVSDDDGAKQQVKLWRLIRNVIDNHTDDFRANFNLILGFINEYRSSVFHEHYIGRFAYHVNMTSEEIKLMQFVLYLMCETANLETRKERIKEISIDRALANGLSESSRAKILGFYNI